MTGSNSNSLLNDLAIKVVRIDKDLPLPAYQTAGAVAFDLSSRVEQTVQPHAHTLLPSNLIIEVPAGYFLMLAARSSLTKRGLQMSNGIGVIDQDYHGPEDETQILVYNFTDQPVTVKRGERIAQGLIIPIIRAAWEEVETIKLESRGGFGSTGKA
jgi:dUTP pyrophosphatase